MGRVNNGILGGFSGKIGPVVGGKWRGKQYMRSRPTRSKSAKRSIPQLEQQAKFATTMQFAQGMKDLLELGFSKYAVGKTGLNSAVSFILTHAITGAYPDYRIDYSQVLICRGSLLNAYDGTSASEVRDTIRFSWTDNSGMANAHANDESLMVAYCPVLQCTMYRAGAARSAGTDTLFIPGLSGKPVHTWMSFIAADQMDIASSIYLGEVTIA